MRVRLITVSGDFESLWPWLSVRLLPSVDAVTAVTADSDGAARSLCRSRSSSRRPVVVCGSEGANFRPESHFFDHLVCVMMPVCADSVMLIARRWLDRSTVGDERGNGCGGRAVA